MNIEPDPYREAAAKMFGVPPERVTRRQRYKGKLHVLAMGFDGFVDEDLAKVRPLGEAIKRLARMRGHTPKMLAYDVGVNPQHMRTLMRGERPFTPAMLTKVIAILRLENMQETLYRQGAREHGFKIGEMS